VLCQSTRSIPPAPLCVPSGADSLQADISSSPVLIIANIRPITMTCSYYRCNYCLILAHCHIAELYHLHQGCNHHSTIICIGLHSNCTHNCRHQQVTHIHQYTCYKYQTHSHLHAGVQQKACLQCHRNTLYGHHHHQFPVIIPHHLPATIVWVSCFPHTIKPQYLINIHMISCL
jgi:hypothetical protein